MSSGLSAVAVLMLVAAVIAAVTDWWAVVVERKSVEYFAKPAVLVFLIAAAVSLDPASESVRSAFVVALLFGLLGDIFLMVGRFIPGAGAFLMGHIAYIVGLSRAERWSEGLVIGGVFVLLLLIPAARIVARAWLTNRVLGGILVAYLVTLGSMAVLAIGSVSWLAGLGAALFAISDAMLAWRRFVGDELAGRVAVHITYHAAQTLLVLSLLQLS